MAQTTHIPPVSLINSHARGNITGSFNKTVYKSDEDAEIMCWLSPLELNHRHQGVRNERFDGVGDRLLETSEFREWRDSEGGADKAVLFCGGNLGVGKTYLRQAARFLKGVQKLPTVGNVSSLVIGSLCDQAGKEGMIFAGLYCDFLTQQEQTITNIMGAISKQLVVRRDIPDYLREAFHKARKEFDWRPLRPRELMRILRTTIASLPQVFICIDALDECLPKHLPKLLESLRDIIWESPKTRISLTGRRHVGEDIQRYFNKVVVIPISPTTDDIKSYLEMRLDGDPDREAMNDDLRADIIEVVLEKISDMYVGALVKSQEAYW